MDDLVLTRDNALRMPKPSFVEPTDDEKLTIKEMRSRFHSEFVTHPDLFCLKDVERVFDSDWEVHRYLLAADGDFKAGMTRLINSMKWRKQMAVWDMSENSFPQEFYQMLRLGRARDGSIIVFSRAQFYIPLNEWRELFKKFFIFVMEWLDRQNTGNGITIVIDCRDSGLSNVDFDFIWFLKPIQSKYYPFLLKCHLSCDIPWILNSVSQLVLSLMPEKTRKLMYFVKRSQLTEFATEDNIPMYLGGTGNQVWQWVPTNCLTVQQVAKRLNLTNKYLLKLESHLRPLLALN